MIGSLFVGACGGSSTKTAPPSTLAATSATATTTAAPTTTTLPSSTSIGAPEPADAVNVVLKGWSFVPDTVTVKAGDVTFYVSNQESQPIGDVNYRHNLVIPQIVSGTPSGTLTKSGDFRPTESGTFSVQGLPAGTYPFYCSYHRMQMTGTLTVTP
jgi:plastocyanin